MVAYFCNAAIGVMLLVAVVDRNTQLCGDIYHERHNVHNTDFCQVIKYYIECS